MAKHFRNTIDLDVAVKGTQAGAEHGVRLAVEHVLSEANKHVPHDEGTLERSGQASTADGMTGGKITGAVSYDTPYAVRQHEDLAYRHDGKGQAKWLETALHGESDTVRALIRQAIANELR